MGLRTKIKGTKVPRILVLRTNLRDNECEPKVTIPQVVRLVVIRVQPATTDVAVHNEEVRIVIRILDGFVHGSNPHQTHGFNLLIREHFAYQASNFSIRLGKLAAVGFSADFLEIGRASWRG